MPAPGTLRIWGFQVASSCSISLTPSRSPALSAAKNRSTSCSLSVLASTLIATPLLCRGESDRQFLRTVTDGCHPGLRLACRFERLDVARHRPKERIGFEAGKDSAHTGMHTLTPPEMPAIVTAHVEPIGLLPSAWIAVRGSEHQAATLALWNHNSFNLHRLLRDASRHTRR